MANPKILEKKQAIIDEIANNVKESSSFIFLENTGLTVAETMELRRKLRGIKFIHLELGHKLGVFLSFHEIYFNLIAV